MTAASRLWIACASALALVAGCGGNAGERSRVSEYFRQVNAIQNRAAPEFAQANTVYLAFSQGKLATAQAPLATARAERAMRITREQLAAVAAPAAARELKRRLLALYDADSAFAHEATQLAVYIPAAARVVAPLKRADAALARALRRKAPSAQAAGLERYGAAVARAAEQFRRLRPPPILNAQFGRQLDRLQSTSALARRLARAVRRHDSRAVARVLLRFRRLASSRDAALSRSAVDAYNRRYASVRAAVAAVQRERARLELALR